MTRFRFRDARGLRASITRRHNGDLPMLTHYTILRPAELPEEGAIDWPMAPSLEQLHMVVDEVLGHPELDRVAVRLENGEPGDMFVDEHGHRKGLERNEAATEHYRRHWLNQHPTDDPEGLPWIVGPAVLFHRRVWF